MMVLLYALAVVGLAALLLAVLPCGTVNVAAGCAAAFMPLPSGFTSALADGVSMVKWLLYVAGDGIGDALVVVSLFMVGVTSLSVAWRILKRAPVINRILN
jgi:hypothetical protein